MHESVQLCLRAFSPSSDWVTLRFLRFLSFSHAPAPPAPSVEARKEGAKLGCASQERGTAFSLESTPHSIRSAALNRRAALKTDRPRRLGRAEFTLRREDASPHSIPLWRTPEKRPKKRFEEESWGISGPYPKNPSKAPQLGRRILRKAESFFLKIPPDPIRLNPRPTDGSTDSSVCSLGNTRKTPKNGAPKKQMKGNRGSPQKNLSSAQVVEANPGKTEHRFGNEVKTGQGWPFRLLGRGPVSSGLTEDRENSSLGP